MSIPSISQNKNKVTKLEYLWLDGAKPSQKLRSKTKVVGRIEPEDASLEIFEKWGYDGSSTNQAQGGDSDLEIQPVFFCSDPIRGEGNYLVLCEVNNPDGTPHATNHRAVLRNILDAGGSQLESWIGFEQEYTMFVKQGSPLGWPENGYPAPQGPFYCGVGADVAFGREIAEAHMDACIESGLLVYGVNAEVMPGQWEFQVGYRGIEGEKVGALDIADQLWVSRYLLNRIAEDYGVTITIDNKPVKGDWNGAGMHTNFSTKQTRSKSEGMAAIEKAIALLAEKHEEHIKEYGANLHERLTGDHETCAIHQFKHGVSNRGASIRIPMGVAQNGYGYFEDRRPGANANPYRIAARLIATIGSIPYPS